MSVTFMVMIACKSSKLVRKWLFKITQIFIVLDIQNRQIHILTRRASSAKWGRRCQELDLKQDEASQPCSREHYTYFRTLEVMCEELRGGGRALHKILSIVKSAQEGAPKRSVLICITRFSLNNCNNILHLGRVWSAGFGWLARSGSWGERKNLRALIFNLLPRFACLRQTIWSPGSASTVRFY